MVRVTLSAPTPGTTPADGWRIEYRIKGSTGAYITATGSPFSAFPIVFNVADPAGTLYEGHIWRDCGALESTKYNWVTPCVCTGAGYSVDSDGQGCTKTTTIAATVTFSNFCLAKSQNAAYSTFGARVYYNNFNTATLLVPWGTGDPAIYELLSAPYWKNTITTDTDKGPMNREGVWIDSDCNGNKDALELTSGSLVIGVRYTIITHNGVDDFTNVGAPNNNVGTRFVATGTSPTLWASASKLGGAKFTLSFSYNNTGLARQVYIGAGTDNAFQIKVNGVSVADLVALDLESGPYAAVKDLPYRIWHLMPVSIIHGLNYFNIVVAGDGSINDAVGMVVYDHTETELHNATSDSNLPRILFKTSNLRGTHTDLATCPVGYTMDTSGGVGNYTCVKVETQPCNSA